VEAATTMSNILNPAPVITENIPVARDTNGEECYEQAPGIPPHLCGPVRFDHPCACPVMILDAVKGIVEPVQQRSKVCIVGYADNSRHLAWYDDPDCEIWGVNMLYRFIPRMDRLFQIHKDWGDRTKWAPGHDHAKWIREAPIPTYMIAPEADLPRSVAYPYRWVQEQLGLAGESDIPGSGLDYFTSTIAYMYALAIAEGFTTIGIYGIDLIIGREYFFEKACVEFYMGLAHGRGISIQRPANSALLWQSHRYGYDEEPDYGFYSLSKLGQRMDQLVKRVQQVRDEAHLAQGAVTECEEICSLLPDQLKPNGQERLMGLRVALDKKLNELYQLDGAHQEIRRMHHILEMKSRGAQVE
jgi:hypothetical protein